MPDSLSHHWGPGQLLPKALQSLSQKATPAGSASQTSMVSVTSDGVR